MESLQIRVAQSLEGIEAQDWDRLVGDASPFLEYAWLRGLETSGCLDPQYGWLPQPLTVWRGEELLGATPLYLKGDSYGEYVYDWSWANLAHRMGVPYYPKIISAVPFTPVSGPRLLVHPDLNADEREEVMRLLIHGALQWARDNEVSGLHFLFVPDDQAKLLEDEGLMLRHAHQYHWRNEGYQDFDDFLARFKAKKRTQIKRERRGVKEAGITFDLYQGDTLTPEVMAQAYHFYRNTCQRFGHYNRQYLNEPFYETIRTQMPERLQVLLAKDANGEPVAGTLTLCKGDKWYGRYWGCNEEIRYLHFEACYYHPIAQAIAQGVKVYEPGAGGGHKYTRGFEPVLMSSAHWIADPSFRHVLQHHLTQESAAVKGDVEAMASQSPMIHAPPKKEEP